MSISGARQKTCEFSSEDFFFFDGDRPNFAENLRLFEPRPFFYESSFALCPWSFGIERVCPRKVCPWPRIFFVSSTPPLVVS